MSHDDGDGKPPNPFATPAAGAANPFEDLMGAAPAQAPNPFANVARSNPEAEGPAITVTRASSMQPPPGGSAAPADDAPGGGMEMLGLEVEERAPPPPVKKVRPELDEWRSEMAHGPAGAPSEMPNLAAASSPRIKALAPPKKGGAQKFFAIAAGIVVLIALVGIGQRVLKGGGEDAEAQGPTLSDTDQLLQLGIRPENAPDCFTRDQGFTFSYLDSGGTPIVVKSISDVPPLYRLGAKCVPTK